MKYLVSFSNKVLLLMYTLCPTTYGGYGIEFTTGIGSGTVAPETPLILSVPVLNNGSLSKDKLFLSSSLAGGLHGVLGTRKKSFGVKLKAGITGAYLQGAQTYLSPSVQAVASSQVLLPNAKISIKKETAFKAETPTTTTVLTIPSATPPKGSFVTNAVFNSGTQPATLSVRNPVVDASKSFCSNSENATPYKTGGTTTVVTPYGSTTNTNIGTLYPSPGDSDGRDNGGIGTNSLPSSGGQPFISSINLSEGASVAFPSASAPVSPLKSVSTTVIDGTGFTAPTLTIESGDILGDLGVSMVSTVTALPSTTEVVTDVTVEEDGTSGNLFTRLDPKMSLDSPNSIVSNINFTDTPVSSLCYTSRGYVHTSFALETYAGPISFAVHLGAALHQVDVSLTSNLPQVPLSFSTKRVPCLLLGAAIGRRLSPQFHVALYGNAHFGSLSVNGVQSYSSYQSTAPFRFYETGIALCYTTGDLS